RTQDHVTSKGTEVGSGAPSVSGSSTTEQAVTSLKVTIQQSSESREFRRTDRQTAGLHCHVCDLTCGSLQ
uniref:Uncharacterized protein n=2 Tax=Tetraodon nigroviridis TaxID=99883 RepID=H3CKL2_TETNG